VGSPGDQSADLVHVAPKSLTDMATQWGLQYHLREMSPRRMCEVGTCLGWYDSDPPGPRDSRRRSCEGPDRHGYAWDADRKTWIRMADWAASK
jgi:hypothetical protein